MPDLVTVINSNLAALSAQHMLARHQQIIDRAVERLATGKRINRASDDPAGLIAADKLATRRVSIEEIVKKAQYVDAMLSAAEGGLAVVEEFLQELNGIAVAAANTGGLSAAEREALQVQANSVMDGIGSVINTWTFNGRRLLAEGMGEMFNGMWIGIPALNGERLSSVTRKEVDPETGDENMVTHWLGEIRTGGALSVIDGDPELAQEAIKGALERISGLRGMIGSFQKYTLGGEVNALRIELENTAAAESQIRDADIAEETSNLIRGQVLREATLHVIRLAHDRSRQALQLLG